MTLSATLVIGSDSPGRHGVVEDSPVLATLISLRRAARCCRAAIGGWQPGPAPQGAALADGGNRQRGKHESPGAAECAAEYLDRPRDIRSGLCKRLAGRSSQHQDRQHEKHGKSWLEYKVHLSETCSAAADDDPVTGLPPAPNLITAVATTRPCPTPR